MPFRSANSRCFSLSWVARSSRPILRFCSERTSSKKRQVVAEKEHRAGIIYRRISSDQLIEENRRHGGDVLMAEAQIGARETGVAGLDRMDADSRCRLLLGRAGKGAGTSMAVPIMCLAKIFSAMVIGRASVSIAGRNTFLACAPR